VVLTVTLPGAWEANALIAAARFCTKQWITAFHHQGITLSAGQPSFAALILFQKCNLLG
jgi:hypothetical protein